VNRWARRVQLSFAGPQTVRQLLENLAHRQRTVLALPGVCHVALSDCLYGTARPRATINRVGGGDLLRSIASIDGLAELGALAGPLDTAGVRVKVRSPAPHVTFNFHAAADSPPDRRL
jgi:hypothetical protein